MIAEKSNATLRCRWLMATIVYIDMFAAFANQFKAPGVFTLLIPELGFTGSNIGYMMSAFSLVGLVLAFPAAFITNRLGIKTTLAIGAVFPVIGSIMGAMAHDATVMLVSRFIEGAGTGLLSVSAAAAISAIVPRRQHGLGFGIRGITFPAGTVVGLNAGPLIAGVAGWRAVWWAGAALALVALVMLVVLFRVPPVEQHAWDGVGRSGRAAALSASVKPDYRGLVLLGVVYMIWQVVWVGGYNSFYATFLQEVHGVAAQKAGFMTSITSIMMVILGPVSGVVSDRLGTRKWLIVFCMFGTAVAFAFGWSESMPLVWVFLFCEGIFAPCVTTGTMAMIPDLAKRQDKVSFGMAINAFFKCVGMVAGPALFGPLHVLLGWSEASLYVLVPLAAVGGLIACVLLSDARKAEEAALEG